MEQLTLGKRHAIEQNLNALEHTFSCSMPTLAISSELLFGKDAPQVSIIMLGLLNLLEATVDEAKRLDVIDSGQFMEYKARISAARRDSML